MVLLAQLYSELGSPFRISQRFLSCFKLSACLAAALQKTCIHILTPFSSMKRLRFPAVMTRQTRFFCMPLRAPRWPLACSCLRMPELIQSSTSVLQLCAPPLCSTSLLFHSNASPVNFPLHAGCRNHFYLMGVFQSVMPSFLCPEPERARERERERERESRVGGEWRNSAFTRSLCVRVCCSYSSWGSFETKKFENRGIAQ